MSPYALLGIIVAAVALILFLVIVVRLHAFVTLLIVSGLTALVAGIPPGNIIDTIETGMGDTLGYIAVVVGLGAMFGEMLRVTGGAEQIARTLIGAFGEQRIQWALALTGLLVAIPVFFDVGLILLIYLVYSITQNLGRSIYYYAIPLLAGLVVAHGFIPPTPGPIAAAGILNADLGWVILWGLIAGIPAVIVGGVLFGTFLGNRVYVGVPEYMLRGEEEAEEEEDGTKSTPSFGLTVSIVLLPLVLILGNTLAGTVLPEDSAWRTALTLIGNPFTALTIAVLLAFYVVGVRHGYSREEVQGIASRALEPVGLIILVTGAGGVFGAVLSESGLGDQLQQLLQASNLPIVVLAFLVAVLVRVSLGSQTVAIVTAASVVTSVVSVGEYSAPLLGAIVIATGAGSTVLSHVNDSGFWLVSRYLGINEKQTLQSWTVMETIVGVVAFLVILVISLFL
ncbi:GntP family permease [Rubrobacter aplysinae]|uniref:GntP family permease n=1 Tax=Rubrobacter aplysinae TaxID=909625 RepID=UPI00064B961D|nr:gluconate:H+ symporter [Rubrobacter aplysinae]